MTNIRLLNFDTVFSPEIDDNFAKLARFLHTGDLAMLAQTCKKFKNACNKKFIYYGDSFYFSSNKKMLIKTIHTFKNLITLSMYACQITNIESLVNLINLQELDIGYNRITNITPLANLVNLRALYISYSQDEVISLFERLPKTCKIYK